MQLRTSVALLARPTFGGLWSQNCLKKENILWEDMIFFDHMPFRMTCVIIAYELRDIMLCCRKCLIGGHVLVKCMSSGWHILQHFVFY